ncbi:two-component response regulator-like PRR37 isoform X1 [Ziziphus jujuba]|uniref:Two-component response regulator-like PRR37 isoform X1 n=1 Tax=Ziziphus jujuba TaxID=326968 RepID=A0A6P3ZUG2_ZIZJJ|nr:two-component response regulator-like PRR37 isoform X1 [Ziziphus jujuba]
MGVVQMNNNVPVAKGLAELNHHRQDEDKEIRDGVTGEGQGLSEEDESLINDDDDEDVNDRQIGVVQVQVHKLADQQKLQQQPQGPLVRWERFLPLRSLKVLLVENDDSTRHVVSALLRNCGYEVISVETGIKAWKILEDLTNHVDLVLSEVVMPCLSGIGLLGKIMSHKTCKNIPVIMMSSHDSMSIVFKCLSKGAVDFLVKPIRKNELKNLWQHVWRKCHSSSGSGSESGIRTQKSTKSKSLEESDNNSGSNNEDDIRSIGLVVRDGSDNGSGTQSSWTKRAEVESPQPTSPWDQLADPPDSTCAQVIHSMPEAFGNNWVPVFTREHDGKEDDHDVIIMGKDLEIGVPSIPDLQLGDPGEKVLTNTAGTNKDKLYELNLNKNDEKLEKRELLELNDEKPNGELKTQAVDLRAVEIDSDTDPQIESVVSTIPKSISKLPDTNDKTDHENKEIPSLELNLKRIRDVQDTGSSAHDRNVLRHSSLSAFSRYNSASIANQTPTGNVGSCSPLDNSSEAAKTESMQNLQSNSNSTPPNQRSNGSSNNNDMGSTTNNVFTKQVSSTDKPPPKSTVKYLHPSSAFQPVHNAHVAAAPTAIQGKADAATANTVLIQPRGVNQQVQVQHHHHHYHHHHHHVHNMPQNQESPNHDDLFLKNMAVAPQCGSSNELSTPVEGNIGNHSLNGSASGSNHGSNGQNGSTAALNPRVTKIENDNGVARKVGTIAGSRFGSRSAVDQNCFTQREAALNKFRQKRKERCFEKKVRYQSRKKLAEQRPRVRGQFVRQAVNENKGKDT